MLNQLQSLLVTTGTLSAMTILAMATGADASEATRSATTVADWVAQIEAAIVEITDVQLEETEAGLQVVLETADGVLAMPITTTSGDALILEIPNARLALPDGDGLIEFEPAEDIAVVQVTQRAGDRVEVSITGTDAAPIADIGTDAAGLTLSVVPGVAQGGEDEDALQILVIGEDDEGYNPSNASTATRTDTPLQDIPQSIQVVPRQVIEDQQARSLQDITRNVSGVFQGSSFGNSLNTSIIRGFQTDVFLRDGFRDPTRILRETADLERIEVLKGPASVLYGTLEPGGIINLVTEQPLEDPLYSVDLTVGSFGFVEPSIDLGGPLNENGTLLYRLNALYESGGNFRDFDDQEVERLFIAPSLTWQISDNTDITFNFGYFDDERPYDRGIVAFGDGVADLPSDRILGELDDVAETESFEAGYLLEHRFSDSWRLRNNFRFNSLERFDIFTDPQSLDESTGILTRRFGDLERTDEIYSLQTNVVGEFATGSLEHTLLFGIDLFRETLDLDNRFSENGVPSSINIFDPEYGIVPRPERNELPLNLSLDSRTDTLGIYLQDQIELSEQWQLLVGGRFDIVDQESFLDGSFFSESSSSEQREEAFSPRLGIVYQPIELLSLYASFTQSFVPNSSVDEDGNPLDPERGTQYEVGIKGDFLDGNLSATLSAFNINKTNIAIADPDLPGVSRPIGEQRSRGVELDVRGEILPGWNIIASYAYTDAEITEDNGSEDEGNRLFGVPEHAASLWTTYEIQAGDLQGLGFGTGIFFVGERQGDTANSFQVPSYTRVDASISYRRDNWRARINFQNLFDIDYIESIENDRLEVYPGAPFTVLATFSIEF